MWHRVVYRRVPYHQAPDALVVTSSNTKGVSNILIVENRLTNDDKKLIDKRKKSKAHPSRALDQL